MPSAADKAIRDLTTRILAARTHDDRLRLMKPLTLPELRAVRTALGAPKFGRDREGVIHDVFRGVDAHDVSHVTGRRRY